MLGSQCRRETLPSVLRRLKPHLYLHHTIGGYDTQAAIFEKLTVAHAVLDDPLTAFREIDRVLAACQRHKRPVYFELPRDRILQKSLSVHAPQIAPPTSDPEALAEAVGEAVEMLSAGRKPVIIAGIDIHRFGLQKQLIALAERKKLVLQSGHVERYNRAYRALVARMDRPVFIEAERLAAFKQRGAEVDVVLDLMIHDLDLACALARAEPVEVSACGFRVLTRDIDIANARIEFANGCVANLSASP